MNSSPQRTPEEETPSIISPFQQVEDGNVSPTRGSWPWIVWGGIVLLIVALAVAGGVFGSQYVNDPYRTLEIFPVGKYYESYRSLAGSKFKGRLTVQANLGWKEGQGKLMVFSTAEDPRPLAVVVAPKDAAIAFQKGQTYIAEIEVKEGGLIHAKSFQKK